MILRVLVGIVLLEGAVWFGISLAEKWTGYVDATKWANEARMNQWELSVCEKTLKRYRR